MPLADLLPILIPCAALLAWAGSLSLGRLVVARLGLTEDPPPEARFEARPPSPVPTSEAGTAPARAEQRHRRNALCREGLACYRAGVSLWELRERIRPLPDEAFADTPFADRAAALAALERGIARCERITDRAIEHMHLPDIDFAEAVCQEAAAEARSLRDSLVADCEAIPPAGNRALLILLVALALAMVWLLAMLVLAP